MKNIKVSFLFPQITIIRGVFEPMLLMPSFRCCVGTSLFPEDFTNNINYDFLEYFRKREVQVYLKKRAENKYLHLPETSCLFVQNGRFITDSYLNVPLVSFCQDKQLLNLDMLTLKSLKGKIATHLFFKGGFGEVKTKED